MAKKTLAGVIADKPSGTTYADNISWWAEVQSFAMDSKETDLPNKNSIVRDCATAISMTDNSSSTEMTNLIGTYTARIYGDLSGVNAYLGS